ncbi:MULTISPECIES: HAD family hydrolase [Actinosynnema]|uniref:Haloacid dehalogenase n=1 Tax=Actinosynnema pretiosum TaxID=42197 RepID=A0A290ZCR6_9PSEU|nr:haloacid dehalogenase-like hydrolase [Actinosynnema pretiosum]ATE56774.1 haloacid dehalogenase [Actinosynnema pretiosum]
MKTLVLWDIDLTLIDASGLGHAWYGTALRTVSGLELVHRPSYAGRTERAISRQLLLSHDLEATDELISRLHAELVAVARLEHGRLAERGRALPGAAAVLEALAGEPGVVQSLVTGNLVEIARYKLAAFGLEEHLDFAIGGFGELSDDRPDLVREAVRLATAKHGAAPESVVVVGDTPHDVDAALHHGYRAVAVATGRSDVAELEASGAHAVLVDLSDTADVVDVLLGRR